MVLGRPLANTQIYILDKELQPVPVGVLGEIHIGGDGVTCGYLNLPELTAEKFIADPFASQPNARMYKTGDLGRFLPDGRIEFMGRIDNQVKIRGFRIELGEIETVLARHTAVQDCVVIAREDVAGDKRLVGYVVPAAGQKVNAAELRDWVKERLPEYMVPVAWVEMSSLPLSPNGKVDRKNLPAPDYERPELAGEYQGARTPTEEVMAGIWAEVLRLDQVGVKDDFFALGGHSLLATQVVSRIRQRVPGGTAAACVVRSSNGCRTSRASGTHAARAVRTAGSADRCPCRGTSVCRSRSPNSVCGSSINWNLIIRATTCLTSSG